MAIHPTAIIDPTAEIGSDVTVGPYSLVGPRCRIGDRTEVMGHVCIDKDTVLGRECRIFPFASLGADPQDLKYAGELTRLTLGDRVTVRESATLHRGTAHGGGETRIGDDALIMATVHVAHDCKIAREAILSSYAVLAGHVSVGFQAIVSGSSAIHQFVRVGDHAFVGGMSGIVKDVPPFMIVAGIRDSVSVTPNIVGLKRRNFSPEAIAAISGVFRILHNHRPLAAALADAEGKYSDSEEARAIIGFYRSSERGVYR
ncbi:MAG: acyl-ACP--UDP-N-acetylglucosamine O-acyltransferase [Deltaproteobacteria bacterium]|jgi:UDP-N-acetylglucosamine acyltransferase|nr:acyl-ACP--UDP-N-acetylglucosamine O-acyltransferase [Deltaproteobacteria bacterium]